MTKHVTIIVDDDGRLTDLIVPEGVSAQVVCGDERDDGSFDEEFYRYDPEDDAGMAECVPAAYRHRVGVTVFSDIAERPS